VSLVVTARKRMLSIPGHVGGPGKDLHNEGKPFEEEVLIESAAAALSNGNQQSNLEKPVCSVQIPNRLLLKWHKERARTPYSACLNKSISQQALQVRSGSRRVEGNLARTCWLSAVKTCSCFRGEQKQSQKRAL